MVVEFTTVVPLMVRPAGPVTATVVPVVVKLVPVMTTGVAVPRTADEGTIEATVGAGGAVMVNRILLLTPAALVTDTFL